jgi:hypothetical protein
MSQKPKYAPQYHSATSYTPRPREIPIYHNSQAPTSYPRPDNPYYPASVSPQPIYFPSEESFLASVTPSLPQPQQGLSSRLVKPVGKIKITIIKNLKEIIDNFF